MLGAVSSECLATIFPARRMIQVNAIWVAAGSLRVLSRIESTTLPWWIFPALSEATDASTAGR